jgi:hypothetical protein
MRGIGVDSGVTQAARLGSPSAKAISFIEPSSGGRSIVYHQLNLLHSFPRSRMLDRCRHQHFTYAFPSIAGSYKHPNERALVLSFLSAFASNSDSSLKHVVHKCSEDGRGLAHLEPLDRSVEK